MAIAIGVRLFGELSGVVAEYWTVINQGVTRL